MEIHGPYSIDRLILETHLVGKPWKLYPTRVKTYFFLTFWSLENHLISKPSQKLDIYLPWNTWYIYSVVNRDFDETLFGPLIIVETEPIGNQAISVFSGQLTWYQNNFKYSTVLFHFLKAKDINNTNNHLKNTKHISHGNSRKFRFQSSATWLSKHE